MRHHLKWKREEAKVDVDFFGIRGIGGFGIGGNRERREFAWEFEIGESGPGNSKLKTWGSRGYREKIPDRSGGGPGRAQGRRVVGARRME